MKQVKIWMGTTKDELIKAAYNNDEKKITNIDVAIPIDMAKGLNTYWHVMDYNENTAFGKLRNLKDVAKENNVQFIY